MVYIYLNPKQNLIILTYTLFLETVALTAIHVFTLDLDLPMTITLMV